MQRVKIANMDQNKSIIPGYATIKMRIDDNPISYNRKYDDK